MFNLPLSIKNSSGWLIKQSLVTTNPLTSRFTAIMTADDLGKKVQHDQHDGEESASNRSRIARYDE